MGDRPREQVVAAFFRAVLEAVKPDAVRELCYQDVVLVAPDHICGGIEELVTYLHAFHRAFDRLRFVVHYNMCRGNRGIARLTIRGFHQRAFYGFAATGRQVSIEAVFEFRFHHDLIRDIRVFYDANTLTSELGRPGTPIHVRKRGRVGPSDRDNEDKT